MWDKAVQIFQTATSMLQTGKVPPNTPLEFHNDLSRINFFRSKKFFIIFSSIVLLMMFFGVSVFILFLTVPVPSITIPFVTIFVETIKIFAIIISVYLGIQATIDFKYQSSSETALSGTNSIEIVDEKIVQEYAEKYKNDASYAPLDWSLR